MSAPAGAGAATDPRLREAIAMATEAARRGGRPFAALLAGPGGELLGSGVDVSDAHRDPLAHAELGAIRAALEAHGAERLAGGAVYASCEPCLLCTAAILRVGIAAVHYAAAREVAAEHGYPDVVAPELLRSILPDGVTWRQALAEEGRGPFRAVTPPGRSP